MAAQKQQPNGSRRKYKLIITLAETKLITKQTKLACNIRTHTLFKVNMANNTIQISTPSPIPYPFPLIFSQLDIYVHFSFHPMDLLRQDYIDYCGM